MATMNKADVKYEEKNIKNVDWNQVRALMGKSVPTVAMQSVKAFGKSNPKAYVKVGLIKKDLYLRVKDGSKHLDDIKLAANWTPPAGAGGRFGHVDQLEHLFEPARLHRRALGEELHPQRVDR